MENADVDMGVETVNETVDWEMVTNPKRLKELFDNTLKDTILQQLAGAKGFNELANDPRWASSQEQNAAQAKQSIDQAIAQVEALRVVLTKEDNLLPIDKRYSDPEKHFINLESLTTSRQRSPDVQPKNLPKVDTRSPVGAKR